jgi:hypothetical protein
MNFCLLLPFSCEHLGRGSQGGLPGHRCDRFAPCRPICRSAYRGSRPVCCPSPHAHVASSSGPPRRHQSRPHHATPRSSDRPRMRETPKKHEPDHTSEESESTFMEASLIFPPPRVRFGEPVATRPPRQNTPSAGAWVIFTAGCLGLPSFGRIVSRRRGQPSGPHPGPANTLSGVRHPAHLFALTRFHGIVWPRCHLPFAQPFAALSVIRLRVSQ